MYVTLMTFGARISQRTVLQLSTDVSARLRVVLGGVQIADTVNSLLAQRPNRAPVYFIPLADILGGTLRPASGQSFCEDMGVARYFDVTAGGKTARSAAWHYPRPTARFRAVIDRVVFAPGMMESCWIDGHRACGQPGTLDGGWVVAPDGRDAEKRLI